MTYSMPWICDCGTKNTSEVDYYFDPVCCSACGAWFDVDYDETYNEATGDEHPIWSRGTRTEKPTPRHRWTFPRGTLHDGDVIVIRNGEVVGVFKNIGEKTP